MTGASTVALMPLAVLAGGAAAHARGAHTSASTAVGVGKRE